jgi:hypothetical protein
LFVCAPVDSLVAIKKSVVKIAEWDVNVGGYKAG